MLGKRLREANQRVEKKLKKIPFLKCSYSLSPKEEKQKLFGLYRKTRCFCSDPYCCGNPRRQKGKKNLTLQERKAVLKEKEGWQEFLLDK